MPEDKNPSEGFTENDFAKMEHKDLAYKAKSLQDQVDQLKKAKATITKALDEANQVLSADLHSKKDTFILGHSKYTREALSALSLDDKDSIIDTIKMVPTDFIPVADSDEKTEKLHLQDMYSPWRK